jgi:hypothetical protein
MTHESPLLAESIKKKSLAIIFKIEALILPDSEYKFIPIYSRYNDKICYFFSFNSHLFRHFKGRLHGLARYIYWFFCTIQKYLKSMSF